MPYKYIGTSIKIADKQIPCDCIRCYMDYGPVTLKVKMDIVLILRYKDKMIQEGMEYTEHLIVDEGTGEECALNCFTELDKVGRRNKLFPEYILKQM